MKRGLFHAGVAVLLLAGCATPDANGPPPAGDPQADPTATLHVDPAITPGAEPTITVRLADCVDTRARAVTSGSPRPVPSRSQESTDPDELWRLRQAENNAFRERRSLSPRVVAANQPCVQAVRTGLERLRRTKRYDAASIERVLTTAGLTGVIVRPAGRLDRAGSGGLLFAGETGQGCVFGEHGRTATSVAFGSVIADGGCLPAPD